VEDFPVAGLAAAAAERFNNPRRNAIRNDLNFLCSRLINEGNKNVK
jgi:hypothetical protein